ncbi:C10 family peptidase [Porphyromonas circumdentaria]|uniref:C10 family peptidase n=1 Tax=Porphyromonas circumdentaria TaxID=29524 RepID=UPI0026DCF0B1|nr:C10 family peptidase [Porphyromonas circumdentaria]MDO4722615.1 C10 family peptidase [Porphyromonas circumdentaria]
MLLKRLFLCIPFCGFLVGCSLNPRVELQPQVETITAEEIAKKTFSTLTGGLRNGEVVLNSLDSLSNSQANSLYLANFKQGGFLLFGTRQDGVEVIGFSESGKMNFSDTIKVPFLESLFGQARIHLSNLNPVLDLGDGPKEPKIIYPYALYRTEEFSVEHIYSPSCFRYFDQDLPFNKYLLHKGKPGRYTPAGCGPIAIATVFSHYRKQGIGDSQVNWDLLFEEYNIPLQSKYLLTDFYAMGDLDINKTHRDSILRDQLVDQLAVMIADISNNAYIYRDEEHTITPKYLLKAYLRRKGFSVMEEVYKPEDLIPYLEKEKRPVVLFGWNKEKKKMAHYWVVDGLAKRTIVEYIKCVNAPGQEEDWKVHEYRHSYFVHCNWGWGGAIKGGPRYDGYFNYKVFNAEKIVDNHNLRSSDKQDNGDYYSVDIIKVRPI